MSIVYCCIHCTVIIYVRNVFVFFFRKKASFDIFILSATILNFDVFICIFDEKLVFNVFEISASNVQNNLLF